MELIHIANATFSSLSFKTKTFRIVKEQTMRLASPQSREQSRDHASTCRNLLIRFT